jgi:hypothetical protein
LSKLAEQNFGMMMVVAAAVVKDVKEALDYFFLQQ